MNPAPLTQWPIIAAVVLVLGLVVALVVRAQRAQAVAVKDQLEQLFTLLDRVRPPPADDAPAGKSGQWGIAPACSPDCRSDVLAAIAHLETKFERLADRMDRSMTELADNVQRHRVRLAVLETTAKIERGDDSARPKGH